MSLLYYYSSSPSKQTKVRPPSPSSSPLPLAKEKNNHLKRSFEGVTIWREWYVKRDRTVIGEFDARGEESRGDVVL